MLLPSTEPMVLVSGRNATCLRPNGFGRQVRWRSYPDHAAGPRLPFPLPLCSWVQAEHGLHFFHLSDGLLMPRSEPLSHAGSLAAPHRVVKKTYPEVLVWVQVGCFYECYDADALWTTRHLGLVCTCPRRGFARLGGGPLVVLPKMIQRLVNLSRTVCLVRELAPSVGPVKTKGVAEYWHPRAGIASESHTIPKL